MPRQRLTRDCRPNGNKLNIRNRPTRHNALYYVGDEISIGRPAREARGGSLRRGRKIAIVRFHNLFAFVGVRNIVSALEEDDQSP
jgi:hypothetical protein